jgi:hypothetical protein
MVKICNHTGVLVVLDAHPDGIIYQDMIRDYVQIVRTIYEGMICQYTWRRDVNAY